MKNWFNAYFNKDFLLESVSGSKFEKYYLYFSILILLLTVGYRLFLFFKGNRPAALKKFDNLWFWGGVGFSLFGLFIWFSRNQFLPLFSTRFVSYSWLLLFFTYAVYLFIYYKKRIPSVLNKYYETERKAKYLKK